MTSALSQILRSVTIPEADKRVVGLPQSAAGQHPVKSAPDLKAGNSDYAQLAERQFIFNAPAGQKGQSHAVNRRCLYRLDVSHNIRMSQAPGLDSELTQSCFHNRSRSRAGFPPD